MGKSRFTVVSTWNTEFILVLLFINYCIIFHMNDCKPTFAPPYTNINKTDRNVLDMLQLLGKLLGQVNHTYLLH